MIQLCDLFPTSVHALTTGQYLRVVERERRDVLGGWDEEQRIGVELKSMECVPIKTWVNSPALAFRNVRFEVEKDAAIRGDFDRPVGSLVLVGDRLAIYGMAGKVHRPLVAIDRDEALQREPGAADLAFTRWQITYGDEGRPEVLFQFQVDHG